MAKKEPKKELFRAHELNEEQAQFIISLLKKLKIIPQDCSIEFLIGRTIHKSLSDCIVCTDSKIICFESSSHLIMPKTKEFSYIPITGASSDNATLQKKLLLHIGGSRTETIEILLPTEQIKELIDFINSKIDQRARQSSNVAPASSTADEIAKYHALKEQGIISEEEFNAKKKELLGI